MQILDEDWADFISSTCSGWDRIDSGLCTQRDRSKVIPQAANNPNVFNDVSVALHSFVTGDREVGCGDGRSMGKTDYTVYENRDMRDAIILK